MMANLLIITREKEAPAGLGDSLADTGMDCSITSYANGVREAITQRLPDVILFELTKHQPSEEIRGLFKGLKRERNLPVIALVPPEMLGNVGDDTEFDDFLTSPCNPAELSLRINRLLHKRRKTEDDELIQYDGLVIDLATCEVTVDDRVVELTFKEYELLKLLASNRGRVFTRDALLDKIWGYDYFGGDRTVDVHIRRLRSKVERFGHTFIETVRNIGYRFIKNT
jgi:two-component system alkaline phosphatase synthesis response regulator PhoP